MRQKSSAFGVIALATTLISATTVNAVEFSPGWYFGGGIGSSWMDPETSGTIYSVSNDQDFAWHVLGGYRINQNFSAEFAYTNLGSADLQIASSGAVAGDISYRQTTLGVLLSPTMKPEFKWRPYLKLGINYSDHSWDKGDLITDDWGAFGGVGVEKFLEYNDFALRTEYTIYAEDAQALNLSLVKYFSD